MNTVVVITTIQEPTPCMNVLAESVLSHQLRMIVVGDRKGPRRFQLECAEFLSIEKQLELPFRLARILPEKHYARKNLGYLLAMSQGCDCIYETDDDNAPMRLWSPRSLDVVARRIQQKSDAPWANVYALYTQELLWPRGLPLDRVRQPFSENFQVGPHSVTVAAPIQQGLANGAPDVDAIWRLVLDREITFDEFPNVLLSRGIWCPFNSQNTWWWPPAFPLLYLPSHCSFRMTDIWRSFVAQRCLWELGYELEFHGADVDQVRNEHNLMKDFEQETAGYLSNDRIRGLLENCELRSGATHLHENLVCCYRALVRRNLVGEDELFLLDAWIEDLT